MDISALTDAIYVYIAAYVREHGYPPTFREISLACHVAASTLPRYLDRLESQGRIAREPGKARGITILR